MKNALLFLFALCTIGGAEAQNDSAKYYFNLGMKEKAERRHLVSYKLIEKAISFYPKYEEAYVELSEIAMEMKQLDNAKTALTAAHEINPKNELVINKLVAMLFNYRQYDNAIALAKTCLSCTSADRIIGISLYNKEDYLEASTYLKRAVAADPKDAEAMYTLGRTLLDMELYKEAVVYYQKAISLDPGKLNWLYELGLIYYNNEDFAYAADCFENAAKAGYVVNNDFNENFGYAALYKGDFDKGEKLLMGVWAKKPNNTTILRDIAEIMYKKKKYDKSLEYCQKLLEMNDKDSKALYQAGLCFIKKGDKEKGQTLCDQAIKLDPSLQGLRSKKEMIGMGI